MVPLPNYRPKQLSLGPLEAEILNIIWELDSVTVKDVHERIISDPNRELTYSSVTTVLRRLTEKGWLVCDKSDRTFYWQPLLTRAQAQAIDAYEQLQRFLEVGNPEIVAGFADSIDSSSLAQLEAIAKRVREARKARQEEDS
ncbi:MAG TPA: CopY family transcriptional regulator [Cyanobacteria bacterium UBA11149]|nr:CopY family transcriptional regulator [Cyanobacteria bacterium UBA11367]HBE56057.1 CopY family transcriptional regulator [Cyanobacteria bacterium UBA11366]HBK64547.1 CopY family transcriptional regulator [Cyanobacteria bacterium UBA11166]HBR77016.1 CopY family transcriptional regulator [Cyanobacteria bacterium UBA11159]HBS70985.1 CopY family transcriptional regulator [Cyanobacteria bacterium UBA11153]HBW87937.1 CopY family transcriptional regulator [Cyanobacteria bacterium UBA11149]HCA9781